MEHATLDNVREHGTDRVYRLTCAAEGLHLEHVTNTSGLNDYSGGSVQFRTSGAEGEGYGEELGAGEEQLAEQLSPEVSANEHSRSYSWGQVHEAMFRSDNPTTLHLHAGDDRLKLDLSNAPPDEVRRFSATLMARVEEEQAGRREMRR